MANSFLVFLGHGIPGIAFILWGLFLFVSKVPHTKRSPWLLSSKRMEFYILFLGSAGTIMFHCILRPSKSYPDLEHISMALPFTIYALAGAAMDYGMLHSSPGFLNLLGTIAFSQELILFHWHSTDHQGVEGHYHLLLQLIVTVCILSSLGEIILPRNKTIKLSRSMSIFFQGCWLFQLSLLLMFPSVFMPQGCRVFIRHHQKIQCANEELVSSSKTLGTLLFSWHLTLIVTGSTILYASMTSKKSAKDYCAVDASDEYE